MVVCLLGSGASNGEQYLSIDDCDKTEQPETQQLDWHFQRHLLLDITFNWKDNSPELCCCFFPVCAIVTISCVAF
jgi:hypothetical protein